MSRPFENGDRAILTGDKRYYTIDYCNHLGVVYLHQRMYVHESSIITIRTPRKGCKEARDIVAMLGRDVIKTRHDIRKWCKERGLKRSYYEINNWHDATQEKLAILEKAKAMLGKHND